MIATSVNASGLVDAKLVLGYGNEDQATFLVLLLGVFPDGQKLPFATAVKLIVGADFSGENLEVGQALGLPDPYQVNWSMLTVECKRFCSAMVTAQDT